ncbi:SDR family oxidoreductase [Pseudomonas aeruginosa]|nr:SDR family oxidoreductase [Pseudomonas aeruginosa]
MAKYRISHDAQADIIDILRFTHNRFGDAARRRYQALIGAALEAVASDPQQVGMDTDMNPDDGDFAEALKGLMALPRYARSEEIASFVAYLAGPEAAYITGASLTIDGGFSA